MVDEHFRAALAAAGRLGAARWTSLCAERLATLDTSTTGQGAFRKDGAVWTLTWAGTTVRLADAKGLADIATLLAHRGTAVPAVTLATGQPPATGADPLPADSARATRRGDGPSDDNHRGQPHPMGRAGRPVGVDNGNRRVDIRPPAVAARFADGAALVPAAAHRGTADSPAIDRTKWASVSSWDPLCTLNAAVDYAESGWLCRRGKRLPCAT